MSEEPSSLPTPATLRVAGQHARSVQRGYAYRALAGIGAALAVLLIAVAVLGLGWVTVGVEAVAIAAMFGIDHFASPLIDRWGRGAAGEERVGQVLDGLRGSGWYALHDINLGQGNIDHVLVGPAGLFTIETKSHKGRINTSKLDPQMLRQAYAEGKLLERITGLQAEPLLVFSDAYPIPAVSRRKGVTILPARMLAAHLERRKGAIPAGRVAEVYARLAAALPG